MNGTSQIKVKIYDTYLDKTIDGCILVNQISIYFIGETINFEYSISYSSILSFSVSKKSSNLIKIVLKNCQQFEFMVISPKDAEVLQDHLNKFAEPDHYTKLLAFKYPNSSDPSKNSKPDNYCYYYDQKGDFERMGFNSNQWVRSNLNETYELCPTYPKYLYFPASATEDIIRGCARFRSIGRLPVLSYYYCVTKAAMCRCAQPLAGINKKCSMDVKMFNCVAGSPVGSKGNPLITIDLRPMLNAVANRAIGKGYENPKDYPFCDFQFHGIENIHVMRESLNKMLEVVRKSDISVSSMYSNGVEAWLGHIKAILSAAKAITLNLMDGINIIVHCSDGWDRTSQVCALVGLMLDPFYRTIKGFQVLIEREYLSFGHKFSQRTHQIKWNKQNEFSPLFTQFLDCVWQLIQQYPTEFEFNQRYLITINDSVFSCEFGTFLCDNERERENMRLSIKTSSLWDYIEHRKIRYLNPLYRHSEQIDGMMSKLSVSSKTIPLNKTPTTVDVIIPKLQKYYIKFWKGLYVPWIIQAQRNDSVQNLVEFMQDFKSFLSHKSQGERLPDIAKISNILTSKKCICKLPLITEREKLIFCWMCHGARCSDCISANASKWNVCARCAKNTK